MKTALRILHLEHDPKDAELVQATLAADQIVCSMARVQNSADFVAALEAGGVDLVLAEFAVPGFDGISALKIVRSRWPDVPCILLSETTGEALAVESVRNGATDYVVKDRISRLVPAVHRALKETGERLERRKMEEQVIRSEKMEMFDQLIAGMTNDFNNVLNVIIGYSDLMMQDLDFDHALHRQAREIRHAAVRASALTKQLLLSCHQQPMEP
jgi:two-component system cell cycle sensor histidine kinase/response regulator CckA